MLVAPLHECLPKAREPSRSISHCLTEGLQTSWTSHNLTDAVRLMMRHALRDPLAQYFAVLSDTGVPLYSPLVVYTQLMAESRSRINACPDGAGTGRSSNQWEWQDPLAEVKGLNRKSWRKSMQSVGLKRAHAEAVVSDEKVIASFRKHCRSWYDQKGYHQCKESKYRLMQVQAFTAWSCVRDGINSGPMLIPIGLNIRQVDEHYMATLLALLHLDKETDCKGYLVTSDWTKPGRHPGGPHEWTSREVNAVLFRGLRRDVDWGRHFGKARWTTCRVEEALDLAESAFVTVADILSDSTACQDRMEGSHAVLTQDCALFARKFPAETTAIVHDTLRNAGNKLRIIPYS